MRVKMLSTTASPLGICRAGQEWEVPEDFGRGLISGGYAILILSVPKPETPKPETVKPEESETAELPKSKKKGK